MKKIMKPFLSLILWGALSLSFTWANLPSDYSSQLLALGSGGGEIADRVKFPVSKSAGLPDLGGRTIIAVTENAYVPLNFTDPATGKGVGFEYDLTETIAFLLNAKLDWRITSWDSMINAVKEGQFDVGMDGITITEEREKEIDFSQSYLHSQQVMLVRNNETRFKNKDGFKKNSDLLVGAQPGTTQFYTAVYEVLDGNENNPRIILLDTFALVVQALLAGDVDMVLMDRVSAEGYIGANQNQLKVIGETLGDEDFGYIFTPESDLKDPFNQAISYLKEKGVLDKLEKYWFYEHKINN